MGSNRYARDWDQYSNEWDAQYASDYAHLGDEWNDDKTPQRRRDSFYFSAYAARWIEPHMTVLEIGPGGGKWTVPLARSAKRLIVMDVSEGMLERTRLRCEAEGLQNVEFLLSAGDDFSPVPDDSIDFAFSYDVFVHIALEDLWPYAQELARVLAPGSRAAWDHAINSTPEAWNRISETNEWYRHGRHTLGQFYYYSPESLRLLYERCGLRVLEQHQQDCHCTSIVEKPSIAVAAKLESLLARLQRDADPAGAIEALRELPKTLGSALAPLLDAASAESDLQTRQHIASQIRRAWRGF